MKAIWKQKIIAESNNIVSIEGNAYFPIESVKKEFLQKSENTSVCHWKGMANYYNILVDGEVNENAAWYYPKPKPEAKNIKGRVAFWKGINVTKD